MKVSLNWLREFVECPKDSESLSELLTMAGVEVEGIHTQGVNIEKVVVAQILESDRHPNADRLSVCKVDDGSGSRSKLFAAPRTTRWVTKSRLRRLALFCRATLKSRSENCAVLIRRE